MVNWFQTHYLDGNVKETGLLGYGDLVAGFFKAADANIYQGQVVAISSGVEFYVTVPDATATGTFGIANMSVASGALTPVQVEGIAPVTVSGDCVAGDSLIAATDGTVDGINDLVGSVSQFLGTALQTGSNGDIVLCKIGL